MIDIKIPAVGESITEVILSEWLVKDGDYVKMDQLIANIESEKASFEIVAEKEGKISIITPTDETIEIGAVVARIDDSVQAPLKEEPSTEPIVKNLVSSQSTEKIELKVPSVGASKLSVATPLATTIANSNNIDINSLPKKEQGQKFKKSDILNQILKNNHSDGQVDEEYNREVTKTKMTSLRKTIARRLTEAKNTTAMLTTFNEVDMSPIMDLRKKFKEKFKQQHEVNLGFMSFFTKAVTHALQVFPNVNSYIKDDHVLSHNFSDVSIAVSTPRGLVVPVIQDAQNLSMDQIEKKVVELATKARDGKLTIEEMTGGTFTITNGGVFGSLLSTPIINIPQSAILGMHKIQERPVAINGKVEIKPMMYLALSYDHRIVDGKESVGFLVHVKNLIENPSYLLTGKDPVLHLLDL